MRIIIERLLSSMVSLGTFYTLALHAYLFPIFRGEYVRAQAIGTDEVRTLTIFAGVNAYNLIFALIISLVVGMLFIYIIRPLSFITRFRIAKVEEEDDHALQPN